MFHLTILNPKQVAFEGDVESVFLQGDNGEFEILSHHAPIVSLLRPGAVIINWEKSVPIKNGMVKFDNNGCVILVEQ